MGRMGLYELLVVTDGFKSRVSGEPGIDALRRQAVTDGMRPLRLAGALRVSEGLHGDGGSHVRHATIRRLSLRIMQNSYDL